ncbi:MAG: hypothetical protein HY293_16175 [Planctomycetes bacterium]|nr:hypothetical protein [Planctomycetota bacterium]
MTTVLLVLVAALGQDPSEAPPTRRARPVRVGSDVRIILEETPKGEFEHDYYEQQFPVEFRSGSAAANSRVWYRTVCRPQDENPTPIFLTPASPPAIPISISGAFGAPHLSVTSTRTLTTIPGNTRSDPIISKPAVFGGNSGPDRVSSSDAPFLYGPDVDLIVAPDLASWDPARWMPDGTSLHFYARALFGSFEVFDTPTTLQLYGVGPRLSVPLLKSGSLELAVTASAGPAFLHTGIGDAVGFDGGIGLRLETFFTSAFSFVAALEANLYFSENVTAIGPVVNLGFNLSW